MDMPVQAASSLGNLGVDLNKWDASLTVSPFNLSLSLYMNLTGRKFTAVLFQSFRMMVAETCIHSFLRSAYCNAILNQ